MNGKYICNSCKNSANENIFIQKVTSIMYRQKFETIQLFKQIICPNCLNLVTIVFEEMKASYGRKYGNKL